MLLLATASILAFQTGNTLNDACIQRDRCIGYVAGSVDTWQNSFAAFGVKLFCAPSGLTQGQAADVFAKYLIDHPEKRHMAASDLVFSAMVEAFPCPKRQRHKK
jgi:Rap1a immunity proteins